ncbi:MAG TPA: sarcosine oxidase subunit gamma family protein [Casimicrobiaceae bacterium]
MADVRAPSDGAASTILAEVELATAWNVRGNPEHASFVAAAGRVLGPALPVHPETSARADGIALLRLGPRTWLFVAGPGAERHDFDAARKALNDAGGALFDVSSSHAAWSVAGASAWRVLNRLCPLDLHPHVFVPGRFAQSVLGHIAASFYRPDERPAFVVIVARSFAAAAWRDLCAVAASEGYRVAPGVPFGAADAPG